jgi:DNA-binding NarL/FixJ family response regulator
VAQAEQVVLAHQSGGLRLHRSGAENPPAPPPPTWLTALTARDVDVLRLLADGRSTAAIADDLAYSESTIKNVIHDLVRQLDARNRAHAVALAIRAGAI